jgi:CRP/FNR family cyclic AMP-dependent transcriptional regulator
VARRSQRLEPLPLWFTLRPGAVPVRQGESTDGPWVVESGALRESIVTPEGRELTLRILGPGDLVGEPDGSPPATTARAIRPTNLRLVSATMASALLAERARHATELAADLAWTDVSLRLERRLADLAARFGSPTDDGVLIVLPLTHDDLASLTGATRETVSRTLHRLTERGVIRVAARGRYVVRTAVRTNEHRAP